MRGYVDTPLMLITHYLSGYEVICLNKRSQSQPSVAQMPYLHSHEPNEQCTT